MPNAIILLHCNEPDGVLLSDAVENLDDLNVAAGSAAPTSVDTFTGKGRRFVAASSQALAGADRAGADTILTRDMTVQALISMTLIGGTQVLLARGLNTGAASERHSFGIELEQQPDFAGYVEARWFWQDSAGNLKVQPGGVWKHPGDGKEFLITATRRWESSERVVLRYYVGPDLVAELVSADGDIAGATIGGFTLGGRQSAGTWQAFFNGTIDDLLVTDHEMSAEEVRHTYRRLVEFQPAGLDMFAGLIPPGLPWARDLGNSVGRHVRHAGESIGFSLASAEELREMLIPDRSVLGTIERWEKVCGLSAKPRDSLDIRRARLVAYLARDEGFRRPSVQESLSGLLDLEPADVEIVEFSNTQTDSFATLNTAERWLVGDGAWAAIGGMLHLDLVAGVDVRYPSVQLGAHVRMPVDNAGDVDGLYVSAKLESYSLPRRIGVGILLACRRTHNALYFGVHKSSGAGTVRLVYRKVTAGVDAGNVILETPAAAAYWLRLAPATDGVVGSFRFMWSTIGPSSGFVELDNVAIGLTDFDWVGFGVFGDESVTEGAAAADWNDLTVHAPNSPRPFSWYAYADPALTAEPDIIGARHLIAKTKPAHTNASAIQSKSLLAGNLRDGLCGRGPCGGF